jgi:hypothetical protein
MGSFSDLYQKKEGDNTVPWTEPADKYIGLDVYKDFPSDCGYKPPVNEKGEIDTIIAIKVGYAVDRVLDGKVPLFVSVGRYSKYLANHIRYNFDDLDSPTKDALDESKQSSQPIDFEDNDRYIFNTVTNEVTDKRKGNTTITINDVVENSYKLYLGTIKGIRAIIYKAQSGFMNGILGLLISLTTKGRDFFVWFNKFFLGKTLNSSREPTAGMYSTYKYSNLTVLYPEGIPFFGSDIRFSKQCVIYICITLLGIWKFGYYHPSFRAMNDTYTLAIIVLLIWFYDYFLPGVILFLANRMINFRTFLFSNTRLFRIRF